MHSAANCLPHVQTVFKYTMLRSRMCSSTGTQSAKSCTGGCYMPCALVESRLCPAPLAA